jgi:hypothetical protein
MMYLPAEKTITPTPADSTFLAVEGGRGASEKEVVVLNASGKEMERNATFSTTTTNDNNKKKKTNANAYLNEPMTNEGNGLLTLSTADQILREEYERHSRNNASSSSRKNNRGAGGAVDDATQVQQQQEQQHRTKKKRDALTSRASSTSPAPSSSHYSQKQSGGSMPQYVGVPPPKSLSVFRREKGVDETCLDRVNGISSSITKRGDPELNSEIDRYIMVTLLERERDVVRGKADVLRATSGKISSALEKERKSLKSKNGKEHKKEKTLPSTTTATNSSDPSFLQDSLSNVFGALFSGVAPVAGDEQQKRNLLEHSGSSDAITTTHMNNDTSVQDLCGELLKNERFTHIHAASGAVLDSRFINGRRDAPGDWVEVAPPSPESRKSRKSSSKNKNKNNSNSPAATATTTATTTAKNTNVRGQPSSSHNITRSERSKPKAPAKVDDTEYFSPIDTPKKQEMKKSSSNSFGNIANVTSNIGADKMNAMSRSSSRSRLSNSASARDKMLNSSGASRSGGGATDNNSANNNNTSDGSLSMGCENGEKEIRTSPDSNLPPSSPREIIESVPE